MSTEDPDRITETDERKTDERGTDLGEASAKAVSALFDIGRVWAAHGLDVGRSALTASAVTLHSAAELLSDLGDRFEADEDPAKS